jgi:outer membrane protein OmpA-like peptidoglycan-associated protein
LCGNVLHLPDPVLASQYAIFKALNMKKNVFTILVFILGYCQTCVFAQGKEYPDGHGGVVYFPLGDLSFADEVVSFQEGHPAAKNEQFRRAADVLGTPDVDVVTEEKALSLGCGGIITLKFTNNVLIDVPGPDLYVFEIGTDIEPTSLSISKDGKDWIAVGKIAGGRADVDISPFVKPGDVFYYVRLEDLRMDCGGDWPGADIDAVGAIGAAMQISLNSSVLFGVNKYQLQPAAQTELSSASRKINEFKGAQITIEGHTDNVGTDKSNQVLSEKRANAVKAYFISQHVDSNMITAKGYGESMPIATNETEEGKQSNRRVTLVIKPVIRDDKFVPSALYLLYDKVKDRTLSGYPKSMSDEVFSGVWKNGIDEAVNIGEGKIYFFKGGEFTTYSIKAGKAEEGPKPVNEETWPGLWKSFDAAVNQEGSKVYFIKGEECVLYDVAAKKMERGYPKQISKVWSGIWKSGIDAAINMGNGKLYFFKAKEYIRFDQIKGSMDEGYPRKISGNWPGLFPDNISAVVNFNENEWYIFKKY